MRNASAALIALINSGTEFYVADCLTIVRPDGTIHRFTNAPENVTVVSQYDSASHTFLAGGVTFRRGTTKLVIGFEVDDLELTLLTDPTADTVTIGGVAHTWPNLAALGYLDGSTVMLERAFMATWGVTTPGTLILFSGALANVSADSNDVSCIVKSDLNLLALPMPRNTYQPGCLHALFDAGCTLVRATFTTAGTVAGGSTAAAIATGLAAADDYYALGGIAITSGPNTGLTRTIKSYLSNVAYLTRPFPNSTVIGSTFSIYPGCDKKQATCSTKFSNLAHFRGYPYVPTPETAR